MNVRGRREGWREAEWREDTAGEHGTIGALWHQPLDSSSRSPKTLNSPTMNCCSGKAGFREFNFQHNWLYSHPLNAKKMVCSVRLCVESFAYSECPLAGGGRKTREGKRWQRQTVRMGVRRRRDKNSATVRKKRKNEKEWMTGRDREQKQRCSEETRRVENVSFRCRFARLGGTVWRTMLLLVECDVCPLSNSPKHQGRHTNNQVPIMQ